MQSENEDNEDKFPGHHHMIYNCFYDVPSQANTQALECNILEAKQAHHSSSSQPEIIVQMVSKQLMSQTQTNAKMLSDPKIRTIHSNSESFCYKYHS